MLFLESKSSEWSSSFFWNEGRSLRCKFAQSLSFIQLKGGLLLDDDDDVLSPSGTSFLLASGLVGAGREQQRRGRVHVGRRNGNGSIHQCGELVKYTIRNIKDFFSNL